jgi:phosphoribosylamine--glycine ligase
VFPGKVDKTKTNTPVDLTKAYGLQSKYGDKIRIYPGSMELRDGKNYALKSRAVGVLGVGESIEEARQISLEGITAIKGGELWSRTDIAAQKHIDRSIAHMEKLRQKA